MQNSLLLLLRSRKILNPLYILFWLILDVVKHYYLLGVVALTFVTAASLLPPLFAQQDNATQLNATSTDVPVLQQVSEKGIYLVELKWPQPISDVEDALQVEIVFNNASAPLPTNTTIPQREGNETGVGTEVGVTVPEVLGGEPMHVESYDMAIYTPDGRKLWEQLDQPGQGGRATQRIELDSNYTGPVSIDISDIRPGGGGNETTTTAADMADSVTFTATIVPEFPLVTVLLAIGIIATIAVAQRRRQWLI
jgi:predicted secreted protein with PEFG-CTERM motif